MKDCNKDIMNYHQDEVNLKKGQRSDLKNRRNANRNRLEKGLIKNEDPVPDENVRQGSDAHGTTIQEPDNGYDIDDGAVFLKGDLKGKQGGDKTPQDAKKMVREALDDGSFKTPPEIKTNCVRVHYNDGPHVDIPVYRKTIDESGSEHYELAGSVWRESDPKGVNEWFKNCLDARCESGKNQMRALIKLLKSYCKCRSSYNLPSGFILSVLTDERYSGFESRLDKALRDLMTSIRDRLNFNLSVQHPVVNERLAESDDPACRNFRDLLSKSIADLKELDRKNCKRSQALKTWKKVFNGTTYFDEAISEAEAEEKKSAAACVAGTAVMVKPYGSHY